VVTVLTGSLLALSNAALYATNPATVWRYCRLFGRLPNVAYPQRYSERMLWRKIVDRDPKFVVFSDKLATKGYLQRICPDLPVPRTLWIGKDADAIPEEALRGDVFVKANHGYNFNYRTRGGRVDRAALKEKTDRWLGSVHGVSTGEWAYSRVEPKLFVEEAIGDAEGDLIEFNVRAGNGRAILGSVIGHNKTPNQWVVYLDRDGQPTAGATDKAGAPVPTLPDGLDVRRPYRLALRCTEKLSVGVDYARFDFMWNGTELYGGEITVYPSAGYQEIVDPTIHLAIMTGWDLRTSHFLTRPHTGISRIYADALRRRLERATRQPPPSAPSRSLGPRTHTVTPGR
jgi:hypothetical protein